MREAMQIKNTKKWEDIRIKKSLTELKIIKKICLKFISDQSEKIVNN